MLQRRYRAWGMHHSPGVGTPAGFLASSRGLPKVIYADVDAFPEGIMRTSIGSSSGRDVS